MEQTVESTGPANGADTAIQAPDPHDYLARVRSDPDFAAAELTKHQSDAAKLRNELKSLAPLKDIVARIDGGAATAAQLIYEQAAVLQHPEVRSVVEHYRKTGTLPTTAAPRPDASSDVYVDPVEKLMSRVEMLDQQMQQISGRVQADRAVLAQTNVQSHLQKIADEFGDDWEVIRPHLAEKAEEFAQTPSGREHLAASTAATWRNLANLTRGEHMEEILTKRAEKRAQLQTGLGTEPRPSTVTTGREAPIRAAEAFRPGAARKLIEEIRRREGRSV